MSFFDYVKQFTFNKADKRRRFIYLDPPYILKYRASRREYYTFELTDEEHAELIEMVKLITEMSNTMIAISHYPCPEYDDLLNHGWRKIEWKVRTHQGTVTEALYMNYPEPEQLHDYRYLGKDKTDRQRVKRKLTFIQRKLMKLPAKERNAVIEAVSKLSTSTPPNNNRRK